MTVNSKKIKKKHNAVYKKNIGLITSVGEDLNSSPSQLKNKKPTLIKSNIKGLFDVVDLVGLRRKKMQNFVSLTISKVGSNTIKNS